MPLLLIYLLKSSLVLTLLYGVYWGVLRKLTFYQLNRLVLLVIIGASLLLPHVRVSTFNITTQQWIVELNESFGSENDKRQSIAKVLSSSNDPSVSSQLPVATLDKKRPITRESFPVLDSYMPTLLVGKGLLAFYLLGALFFTGKIFLNLLTVLALTKTGNKQRVGSCRVIYTKESPAPFSFFNIILLNPHLFTSTQLEQIIQHEQVHAREWHSLDVLLGELFGALFWFHPLAYLLKKEVKLNLEYIADRQVLLQGLNRKEYQYNLLRISAPTTPIPAVNYFNISYLKNRIYQMNLTPSSRLALWRYSFLIPAITLLLFAIQPMNAAQNDPAQTSSRAFTTALGTTFATEAMYGTSLEPTKSQTAMREGVIKPLNGTEITSFSFKNKEVISLMSLIQSQLNDTLADDKPVDRGDLQTNIKSSKEPLVHVKSTDITPISSNSMASQTDKASRLNSFLKLESSHSIYLAIRASLDKNTLQVIENTLGEKGVQVSFTNVRYNAQGQLIRISMQVRIGNCNTGEACFEQALEAYNDGEPLQHDKPLVFYLSRRADKLGVYVGYPEDLPASDLSALQNFTGIIVGIYGSN